MDALITEAKNGDKEAFVRLIRMNKQSLYKTAWIYLREPCNLQFTSPHIPTPLYFPDVLQSAILQMSL